MRRIYRRGCLLLAVLALLGAAAVGIYMYRVQAVKASLEVRPLEMGLVGSIDTVEPAMLSNHNERLLASMLYEGLLYYNEEEKELESRLADKWSMSSDCTTVVFSLNKEAKFSNGKPLTAGAVKAAWEHSLASCREWSQASLFLSIQGVPERLEGKAEEISGIQVVNDHALKITLNQPNAVFPTVITNPIFWVFDCAEGNGAPYPGTGPFKVIQNPDNRSILLARVEDYYRDKAMLTAVKITVFPEARAALEAYVDGKLDYLDTVPLNELSRLKQNETLGKFLVERPLWESYALGFNLKREPFKDNYLLRRALNYAIDRQALIDEVLGGSALPLKGVVPQGMPAFHETLRGYSYDPDKAQSLLQEAGYPGGQGLPSIVLTYNKDEGHRQVAEKVAQQLGKIGVSVKTEAVDWTYFRKQLNSFGFSFFRVEWRPDYPDPDSFLYSMYHSSQVGVCNFTSYCNPQVDKILEQSRAQKLDSKERIKSLNRAEEIIVDDAPCLWLFQRKAVKMVSPQVQGFKLDGMENIDWQKIELHKAEV